MRLEIYIFLIIFLTVSCPNSLCSRVTLLFSETNPQLIEPIKAFIILSHESYAYCKMFSNDSGQDIFIRQSK